MLSMAVLQRQAFFCMITFGVEIVIYRNARTQWSERVQVPLGTGVEGPPCDEYSWRKYGQKNILGTTFPR